MPGTRPNRIVDEVWVDCLFFVEAITRAWLHRKIFWFGKLASLPSNASMKKVKINTHQGRRDVLKALGVTSAAGMLGLLNPGFSCSGRAKDAAENTAAVRKSGPVGIHANWYYFSDEQGNPLVFTGSHTWGRRRENKMWVSDGWDLLKFNKYLDFLQHWNHNYIRLWMWEQEGTVNIWEKTGDGKFDLTKLNEAFFDRTRAFVEAARARRIYLGVMLFQGWSGTCEASIPDWPRHPMNRINNVNNIHGATEGRHYGDKVHSLDIPGIVAFQEQYVRKMIDTLNGYDNIIWEIANETIRSSIPWKAHMVQFIRDYEKSKPKQHLVLTGTGNGVGNDSIQATNSDTFSPCVVTKWASLDDPFIGNPPIPDEKLKKPIILDNDHLGNHFLRFTPLNQRNWTWKSFTRGNHPIHMDCYDVFWDGEPPKADHPLPGVATHPHYDPQRKSLGDVQHFARKLDLAKLRPVSDPLVCSTTFCLVNPGREYLAYQPDTGKDIRLQLPAGHYVSENFNTISSQAEKSEFSWKGGSKIFPMPAHVSEDWVLYVRAK